MNRPAFGATTRIAAGCCLATGILAGWDPSVMHGDDHGRWSDFSRRGDSADTLVVESVELGAIGPDSDSIRVTVFNSATRPILVGLTARFLPGLWLANGWEQSKAVLAGAGERRTIAIQYRIRRMTTEASLFLALGEADSTAGPRIVDTAWQQVRPIGRENSGAFDPRPRFAHLETEHLQVYARRGSLAETDLRQLADQREEAIRRVAELVGTVFRGHIMLVFYPDSASKYDETGHIGMGWASNDAIVEIYNARQKLDPFHEVAHIVAGTVGSPPAVLDEGFATYISELLGADALEYLGHPGRTVDQASCDLAGRGKRIPLEKLLTFAEFGSGEAPGDITYPQGASLVKYLIESRGAERFRQAYRMLTHGGDPVGEFRRIFGDPGTVERAWWASLGCDTRRSSRGA